MKRLLFLAFFVILLTTEFLYIDILGGIARPYHFLAALVVLALFKHWLLLLKSEVFLAILFFCLVNIVAALLSDAPQSALVSTLSLFGNVTIAMSTALVLLRGGVSVATLKQLILRVTSLSVVWGLVQISAFAIAGIVLALSQEQVSQIELGFGPGFRTEANTFAKYLIVPLLLFVPNYMASKKPSKLSLGYLLFVLGLVMNFTRIAIYGLVATFAFLLAWYATQKQLGRLLRKAFRVALVTAALIAMMILGVFQFSEYAAYKLSNLFVAEEILEGGSSAYRLQMMAFVLDQALSSTKHLIIGNGWGQTYVLFQGLELQAGGADLVNVLGFAGLVGVFAYLVYTLISLFVCWKAARRSGDPNLAALAEGVMFATVGVFITSQMSGYLITPEYWLLIGLAVFINVRSRKVSP